MEDVEALSESGWTAEVGFDFENESPGSCRDFCSWSAVSEATDGKAITVQATTPTGSLSA